VRAGGTKSEVLKAAAKHAGKPEEAQEEFLLKAALSEIDVAASAQIGLLQERRIALISAAVTGKIDVRGWQPPPSKTEDAVA
jgi:type I restriction enzyme S subunit